jgi:hypothetical protein
MDCSESGQGQVEGSCEDDNEPPGFLKYWEILEYLSYWRLLKNDSAPFS